MPQRTPAAAAPVRAAPAAAPAPLPPRPAPGVPPRTAESRQPHMMRVVKAPQSLNTTNCVILNPEEWGHTQYVVVNGRYTFTARYVTH